MQCPKCEAAMEAVQVDEVEVDRCVRCGGLWFDAQEHETVRRIAGSEAIDSGPAWQAAVHNAQGKAFCPRDGTLMRRVEAPTQPEIWIERCRACDGSFFDAGEFTELKDQELGELVRRSRPVRRLE